MLNYKDRRDFLVGAALYTFIILAWLYAIFIAPTDEAQGEVYRIIYLHVPAAICSFVAAYILFVASILTIWLKKGTASYWGKAASECGLCLTLLTLATGSIWGYPTWGVWWTWDARITTTFLLALLYGGYLMLYSSMPEGSRRDKACAVLGILIAIDVPIIYKSVTWWRTLHQPPSIIRAGGSTMDPEMLQILGVNFFAMLIVVVWAIWVRTENLKLQRQVDLQSYSSVGG